MMSSYRVKSGLLGLVALTTILCGCGTDAGPVSSADSTPASESGGPASSAEVVAGMAPIDPMAKKRLRIGHINSVDPQFPIANVSQFTTIIWGEIVDFRDGPAMADYPGDDSAQPWTVAMVEPVAVLRGDAEVGSPVYVQLTVSDREGSERAIPSGTLTLMAIRPLDSDGDKYLIDPRAGVPDGETRYIAGAPHAAFADGPNRTWFPVLGATFDRPIQALVPADLMSLLPKEFRQS